MNHTYLLNYLISKHNLQSYLEIGVNNPERNFDLIKCKVKVGVDPAVTAYRVEKKTSDEFFRTNTQKFSLIFIDGLHHADQVKRDFENSLKVLNEGGFIVIHDTLPDKEEFTIVPRETRKWYGDVYKFAMTLGKYEGIWFVTLNMDCGCTVVWKDVNMVKHPLLTDQMNWQTYQSIGKVLLNVIEPQMFFKN